MNTRAVADGNDGDTVNEQWVRDPDGRWVSNSNGPSHGKVTLLSLDDLDGRTLAARHIKSLIAAMEEEYGGDLTVAQRQLVQHAAILAAMTESMVAQWVLNEKIDLAVYSMLVNTQRRVLAAL
jgi:hypothetical protein